MPSLSPSTVHKPAIRELVLAAEMVLAKHLGVRLESVRWYELTCNSIKHIRQPPSRVAVIRLDRYNLEKLVGRYLLELFARWSFIDGKERPTS